MRTRIAILAVAAVILAACPLPFEFVPENTTGDVSASNDPANPSLTAAPVISARQTTTGISVADGDNADPLYYSISSTRDLTLELSTDTPGAVIFYTLDGSAPSPGDAATFRYTPGQSIDYDGHLTAETIKAIAIGPGMYPSLTAQGDVGISYAAAGTPTFSQPGGVYTTDLSISIDASPERATVYYRIADGDVALADPDPAAADTGEGTQTYTGPIAINGPSATKTIVSVAIGPELQTGAVARQVYVVGSFGIPTGVSATNDLFDRIKVSWDVVPGATGYEVWRSTDGTNYSPLVNLTGSSTVEHSDGPVSRGATYYYRVAATDDTVVTDLSAAVAGQSLTFWYVTSWAPPDMQSEPWGSTANIDAMNAVFGAGGWTQISYSATPSQVLQPGRMVFIEGGDANALEFASFMATLEVGDALASWVEDGGKLFVNAAPNLGTSIPLQIGATYTILYDTQTYETQTDTVVAGHPILSLRGAIADTYTGTQFGHAMIDGAGMTDIIIGTNNTSSLSGTVLAEFGYGAGSVLLGGMTMHTFHSPQPDGATLREAMLEYLADLES